MNDFITVSVVFSLKLDALRAFTRASYHSIKSYFKKMRIGHNKSKLKNQDILAQEFRLEIYYSSCFVEYPPNPVASCEFKPFWFKNQEQLSTHFWRTCLQRIFRVSLQRPSIKPRTWNIPEHPRTLNNYNNYGENV